MDKRYLTALLVSFLVVLAYPHYLRWVGLTPSHKTSYEKISNEEQAPAPLPAKPTPEGKTFSYQNKIYKILFSNRGGTILTLKQGETTLYEAGPEAKGIFGVTILHETKDLSGEIFKATPGKEKEPPLFVYEKPGEYRMVKRFFIGSEKPTLVLEVQLENLSGRERRFSLKLNYELEVGAHHPRDEAKIKMVRSLGGEVHSVGAGILRKKTFQAAESAEWHGLIKKYYTLLIKPDSKLVGHSTHFEENRLVSHLTLVPLRVAPGERKSIHFLIYAGPERYETLRELGLGFEKILSEGLLGLPRIGLLISLHFLYRLAGNYGVAILMITLLIKLAFTPLTHLSYQSMGKMQALQPKIKSLQKQHQKDPGRMNKELMELYRRNRVNPMMGCLPLVLQIPIFISFYQVLSEAVELKGAGFLWWIHDLSEPDRLFSWPTELPFVGNAFNLLPLLMIGSMLWQQRLTPQTAAAPGQEKLMYLTPVIFGFVFYNLPSGLVLYWLANNLLTIFHQLVIKRIPVILHHEDL